MDRLRAWFPDLRALFVVVPLSVYSVGEPGLLPLTFGLFVAWLVLFVRWWKRADAPRLRSEPALPMLAVVVGFGSLIFAATPSLAFRASRGAMQAEAEAILSGESAATQGAQFVGAVPVWSIDVSCGGAVYFRTSGFGFFSQGYAFSDTDARPEASNCSFLTIGDGWYWATRNTG